MDLGKESATGIPARDGQDRTNSPPAHERTVPASSPCRIRASRKSLGSPVPGVTCAKLYLSRFTL
jgi:hypothetical protein